MENNDRYLLQKYNEREYGIFDTEKDKFIQKGSLKVMQGALKDLNNPNKKSAEDMLKDLAKEPINNESKEDEEIKESYNGFGSKLTESKTDVAAEAIQKYIKEDGSFDTEWFNESVQLQISNVEYLYNKMYNSQSPAHSVAYSGMLQLFSTDGYELTSRQVQAGFKKLGLDFKEILKPTTDWVSEKRAEEKEESKEIKTEDMVVNPKIKDLANEVFNWYDSDMGNHFDEIKDNEKEVYNHILSSLENKDKETIDVYIKDMSEDDTMTVVVNQLKQLKDGKLDEELFSASDEVKEDSKEKGLYTESVESDNIERIKDCMKQSGIKNPNTLERMSKDVLAILHTYNEDTRDENGLYYFPAILNAIQDKIEQITGKRPELTIESKEVKTESNIPEYVLEAARNLFNEINKLDDIHSKTTDIEQGKKYVDKIQELTNRLDQLETQYHFGFLDNGEIKLNEAEKIDSESDEEKTILDYLQDRIGQKIEVSELNTVLQSLFARYDRLFITYDDVINSLDWDEPQELYVTDDDDTYTIIYNIVDIEEGIVEITDVIME